MNSNHESEDVALPELTVEDGVCPHCETPLIMAPSVHNPGTDAPTCPECDYEYDAKADAEDDREVTKPIEEEIERSR